jgi:hypothetical protein
LIGQLQFSPVAVDVHPDETFGPMFLTTVDKFGRTSFAAAKFEGNVLARA